MVAKGLKHFRYAPLNEDGETYGTIGNIIGAMESSFTPTTNTTPLYGDDEKLDTIDITSEGELALKTTYENKSVFAPLLGKTVSTYTTESGEEVEEIISNKDDEAKFVGFGQIVPVRTSDKTNAYTVEFLYKVKFKPFFTAKKTKQDSIEIQNPDITGSVFCNSNGDYHKEATFSNEEDAIAYLDSLFVQSA